MLNGWQECRFNNQRYPTPGFGFKLVSNEPENAYLLTRLAITCSQLNDNELAHLYFGRAWYRQSRQRSPRSRMAYGVYAAKRPPLFRNAERAYRRNERRPKAQATIKE